MPYLIGTDEAGYGPNLGPLVVSATLWSVTDPATDLYDDLSESIRKPGESCSKDRIEIGDSKQLYQPHGSLSRLERGVLAPLASIAELPTNLCELVDLLTGQNDSLNGRPWFAGDRLEVPNSINMLDVADSVATLDSSYEDSRCRVIAIRSAIVFPDQFNDGVEVHGNKATLLSATTMRLVREMAAQVDEDVFVSCDRHGGRSRYAALLQEFVTESYVRVIRETPSCSCYTWVESDRTVEIQFITKGERVLATGLASMVSKYVRELCMIAWNGFWRGYLPDLRPTAGYPVDAKRFKADISGQQEQLQISDHAIWRCR